MLYFAYGSNLNPGQMQRRCPGAQPVGRAVLHAWQLIMTTKGTANIVRAPGKTLHGAVWRFLPHHLALMDRWEGVAHRANRRAWLRLTLPDGSECAAVTYIGVRNWPGPGKPHYIVGAMLKGAAAFELPRSYQEEIRQWLPRRPTGSNQQYRGRRTRKLIR
ncbi:MAG: gamma-glutamylcyclotransferase family protein [Hyphomicrobiaceae bacterium]